MILIFEPFRELQIAISFTAEPILQSCDCNPLGSVSLNCDDHGLCDCKENVVGDKCDQCAEEHFNFPNCTGIYLIRTVIRIIRYFP